MAIIMSAFSTSEDVMKLNKIMYICVIWTEKHQNDYFSVFELLFPLIVKGGIVIEKCKQLLNQVVLTFIIWNLKIISDVALPQLVIFSSVFDLVEWQSFLFQCVTLYLSITKQKHIWFIANDINFLISKNQPFTLKSTQ